MIKNKANSEIKILEKSKDSSSIFWEWEPFIYNFDDPDYFPAQSTEELHEIADDFLKSDEFSSRFEISSYQPADGRFRVTESEKTIIISRQKAIRLIKTIAYIYNISEEKANSSPGFPDVFSDIEKIKEASDELYRVISNSNYFTKYFFHVDEFQLGEWMDEYIRADGEGLPSSDLHGWSKPDSWLRRLSALKDMMDKCSGIISISSTIVKGPLYQRVFGSPKFILVLNCYILHKALFGRASGARNGWVTRLSERLLTYARGTEILPGWAADHVRAVHKWEKALVAVSEKIEDTRLFVEQESACEAGCSCSQCQKLQRLTRLKEWLIASPGRLPSQHMSRGNFGPISDPIITSAILDLNEPD